ncbi:MAG TPA: hypothetical protein V6C97_08405 [Oculatellaceae cyanobacterium]
MPNIVNLRLFEQKLLNEFLKGLEELPNVSAELRPDRAVVGHSEFDAQIDLKVAGRSNRLLVEIKRCAYPRDVQQAIWQLRRVSKMLNLDDDAVLVLLSEYLSPGAKQLLESENVGYYDAGGSLYLPAPGAYLYVERPPARAFERSIRSLFSGRRAQVLHALLMHSESWFGVHELAEMALVSAATASEVLSELERMDWLSTKGRGPRKERRLTQPDVLLDSWVRHVRARPAPSTARYYVPGVKFDGLLDRIVEKFSTISGAYAVTSEAAAQLYAPFLSTISQVRLRLLNTQEAQIAFFGLGGRPVTEGSNLAIIDVSSPGELLFRNRVNNVWLSSPVQVYLDLQGGEGRSADMADHLRKEKIGF